MARFDPNHASLPFDSLAGKVVVITGGSSGIGAATVELLHSYQAIVVSGDLSPPKRRIGDYIKTDVTRYDDNLALFRFALQRYGRVDHAVANAGMGEPSGWFQANGIASLEQRPSDLGVDINLKGLLYFAHIALEFLAHTNDGTDKSLTLLSSQSGFKESHGIFVYTATKHAVLGLLRSLRLSARSNYGARVNAICPSFTITPMAAPIQDAWIAGGYPVNQAEDLARVICGVIAAGPGTRPIWHDQDEGHTDTKQRTNAGDVDWNDDQSGVHGRSFFVMGNKVYDIEEGLDRTENLWLGTHVSRILGKTQSAWRRFTKNPSKL